MATETPAKKSFSPRQLFLIFLVLGLCVALLTELSDDEAYYWSWTLKPDWSYFDHPPLQAWFTMLTTWLFGKTNFAVRLPAVIGTAITGWQLSRWCKHQGLPGQTAIWILISSPIFYVFSWMALPDVFFLPLALCAVNATEQKKWLSAAAFFGCAILAKWHGLLLLPPLGLALLVDKQTSVPRKILLTALIALIVTAVQTPVIYWNAVHDWVSFRFHFIDRHAVHPHSPLVSLGNWILFVLGFLGIGGLATIVLGGQALKNRSRLFANCRRDFLLLSWAAPFFIVFSLSAFNGEGRIYWSTFAIFPTAIFFFKHASLLERQFFERAVRKSFPIFCSILIFVLFFPVGAYVKPLVAPFKAYDLRLSPRGDLRGWREWAAGEEAKQRTTLGKILFVASDFRLASQLMWNSSLEFDQISAVDFYHQYALWPSPKPNDYARAVFFGDNRRGTDPADFQCLCEKPVSWTETSEVSLLGQTVKVIHWTDCPLLDPTGFKKIFAHRTAEQIASENRACVQARIK